jgi:hypothetical protein
VKVFKRVLIGCLGLVVLVIVGLAVTAGILVALGPPPSQPGQPASIQEPLAADRPLPVEPAPGEVPLPAAAGSRVAVSIDLEEGEFDVRPGQPGAGIRVEGEYDAGIYELRHETTGEGDARQVRISFRPRYTLLRRLLTIGAKEPPNRLTVFLPPDVAMDLRCRISKGESRIDLGGLPLAGLDLDLTMGDHTVRIDEPNPLSMDRLRLRVAMGEFDAVRLGNARFREARIEGSMGEFDIDLGGSYVEDATVGARFRMGEARLIVPSDLNTEVTRSVFLGEAKGNRRPEGAAPRDAPRLRVAGSVTMGEFDLRWD